MIDATVKELELEQLEGKQEIRLAYRYREKHEMLRVRAIGIEKFQRGERKIDALKVYYKGNYGYIPKDLMADDYEFRSLQSFTGKEFDVIVDAIIEEGNNTFIFLANRKEALSYVAKKYLPQAKVGDIVPAFVSGVDAFNVWLLVNGIRVVMGRDEYSYKYKPNLQMEVFLGDTFDVKVTEVDIEKETIRVSKKLLDAKPLDYLEEYLQGSTYLATIENIDLEHGVFLSLQPRGVTARAGFPPIDTARLIKVGDEVNLKITRRDLEKGLVGGLIIVPRVGQLNRAQQGYRR